LEAVVLIFTMAKAMKAMKAAAPKKAKSERAKD
jgi:hypothetical protein